MKVNRQSSRFIEAFRNSSVGPNPLTELLSDATSLTSSPAEMARSRMIVAPLSSYSKANKVAVNSSLPDSTFESYLAVVLETAKTKRGESETLTIIHNSLT